MIWVLGVLCALALVALFFPFIFWIDFGIDTTKANLRVRLFKKVLYSYEKAFHKSRTDKDEKLDAEKTVSTEDAKSTPVPEKSEADQVEPRAEPEAEPKAEPENTPETENETVAESTFKESPATVEKKEAPKPTDVATETDAPATPANAPTPEKTNPDKEATPSEKEEKRSLTDKEFWTLLLTPEFDSRAWWSIRHALSALFRLFRIRFIDCFCEGIRFQEYENMGYAAALNGFLKTYPYIGSWDFRMDWTHDHEPRAEGHVRASVNLSRLIGLLLATVFYGGIVAWSFWRRRSHILKTGELPELGFVRSKIVKMMEDN